MSRHWTGRQETLEVALQLPLTQENAKSMHSLCDIHITRKEGSV